MEQRALHRIAAAALCACALLAALVCAGCESYEPESTEAGALAYYQDKYQEKTTVAESHGLGNYALFGYSYSGMEYVMEDGVSVVYYDDEGVFRDNRQSKEIQEAAAAFANQELAAISGAVVTPELTSVGDEEYYQTYEGSGICWHTRYDGDIQAFLQQEHPALLLEAHTSGRDWSEGRFAFEAAYDADHAQNAEDAYLALAQYFDIRPVELVAVDAQTFEHGESTLFDDAVLYTISFAGESASAVAPVHFKPKFVALFDGATISSNTRGVTLVEGDVSFTGSEGGFRHCRISGNAATTPDMVYYIRNDSNLAITHVTGIDRFGEVCPAGEHRNHCALVDGDMYYLGDPEDIAPRVEIESIDPGKVRIRYHTFFKDRISDAKLRVIGFAQREGSSSYETVAFDSRIIEETSDGWRCEIDIPDTAKPDNELAIQLYYNGDKNVSVQIMQEVELR